MSDSFTILIYPHQRLRHLQPAVDGLADAVMRLYGQDMSALRWAERREGTLARFEGGVCPEMAARIPSAKTCAVLIFGLTITGKMFIIITLICGNDGIGRRAGFRFLCRKA